MGSMNCADSARLYPALFHRKPGNFSTAFANNPTELNPRYTAPAFTREGFEELRTFEM